MTIVLRVSLIGWLGLAALACDSNTDRTRTWRASDHDVAVAMNDVPAEGHETKSTSPAPNPMAGKPMPNVNGAPVNATAMRAWAKNCMRCHGRIGKGDGPDWPSAAAFDLSQPDWQGSRTDADIAETIRKGKGMMPAFMLDQDTVSSLVQLIRQMGPSSPSPATK